MRATWPLILTLAVALSGGCAKHDAEPEPAAEPAAAVGHPALNKLEETKKKMDAIEAQRKAQADEAGVGN
jgi:hypothetical protein